MPRKLLLCMTLVFTAALYGQNTTPVNKATETDQARVHSNLVHEGTPGQIQEKLAASNSSDVYLTSDVGPAYTVEMDPASTLENLSCGADLAVLGTLSNPVSHPTSDQSYIYTDWTLTVEEIIQNNKKASVKVGQSIVITHPGGQIDVNGRHVHAQTSFPSFQNGQEVLLYLRHLPTNTYALGLPPGFTFSGNSTRSLHNQAAFDKIPKPDLLAMARKNANHCGGQQ